MKRGRSYLKQNYVQKRAAEEGGGGGGLESLLESFKHLR